MSTITGVMDRPRIRLPGFWAIVKQLAYGYLATNVLLTYNFVLFLRRPSAWTFISIFLVGIVGIQAWELFRVIRAVRNRFAVLFDFVRRYPGITYERIDLSALLSLTGLLTEEEYAQYARLNDLMSRPLTQAKAFRIRRGESKKVCPSNVSYPNPPWESYVFFRESPFDSGPINKFFFWHEIGHAVFLINAMRDDIRHRPILLLIPWAMFSTQWSAPAILIVCAFCLTSWTLTREWRRRGRLLTLHYEMVADMYGLLCLDERERLSIAGPLILYIEKYCSDLTASESAIRLDAFRKVLEDSQDWSEAFRTFPIGRFLPRELFTAHVLSAALATFAILPNSGVSIVVKCLIWLGVIVLATLIMWVFSGAFTLITDKAIQAAAVIPGRPASSAEQPAPGSGGV